MCHNYNITGTILFILFLLVAYIDSSPFSASSTEYIIPFSMFSAITGIYVILKLLVDKTNPSIKFNNIDKVIFFLFFFILIRILTTKDFAFNNGSITAILLLCSFYFFIKFFSSTSKNSPILLTSLLLLTGFIQSVIGLLQAYDVLPMERKNYLIVGTFDNPAFFSGFLAPLLAFSISIYWLSKKHSDRLKFLKYFSLLTTIVIALCLPISGIRGDYLAVLVGTLIMFILANWGGNYIKKLKANLIRIITIIIISITLSTMLLYVLYNIRPTSVDGRLFIWKIATNMFLENPIFGIGIDRFEVEYNIYQAKYFENNSGNENEIFLADNVKHAHNEILEFITEAGLLGLIFLIVSSSLVILTLQKAFLNTSSGINKTLLIACVSYITSAFVSCFFGFPLHILPTLINLIIVFGLMSSLIEPESANGFFISSYFKYPIAALMIPLFTLIIISSFNNYLKLQRWFEAVNYSFSINYETAISMFSELLPYFSKNGDFLIFYGGTLYLNDNFNKSIEILTEAKKYSSNSNLFIAIANSYSAIEDYINAEYNYLIAANIVPNRLYPKYLLSKMYFKKGDLVKANELANFVLKSNAKFPSKAEDEIKNEIKKMLSLQGN